MAVERRRVADLKALLHSRQEMYVNKPLCVVLATPIEGDVYDFLRLLRLELSLHVISMPAGIEDQLHLQYLEWRADHTAPGGVVLIHTAGVEPGNLTAFLWQMCDADVAKVPGSVVFISVLWDEVVLPDTKAVREKFEQWFPAQFNFDAFWGRVGQLVVAGTFQTY